MNISFSAEDILEYGVSEIIDSERITRALENKAPLRVKLGIDPTSPNVHLGRSIPLWKLRAFQELGNEIHLIIGDFTGQVGDTSDKESERPMLTPEQIHENVARYEEQLWMVLNPDKKDLVHIHYNSEWLSKLSFGELVGLADAFSVNTFIKRELVSRRLEAGSRVSLREMLYPVMQGYDSLMVEADVEMGGTDQRFNLLAGRTLQEQRGLAPQSLIMNVLISGTDGRKMSSSWGNVISLLDSPKDKFGKMMTVPDASMAEYLLVLPRSIWPFSTEELADRMTRENPRDLKMQLAWTLVALYHGEDEASQTRDAYVKQFSEGELPEDIVEVAVSTLPLTEGTIDIVTLLTELTLAPSRSEARRLIEQGGVRINDVVQAEPTASITPTDQMIVQVGKRNFRRLTHG
ncbi:MAG TPA: tyrosine--tRNA ligase [Verrucomicrobiae bacterium]|nr:tyrosine--tRNA ligase [Verrucomicrobiae bacterium]